MAATRSGRPAAGYPWLGGQVERGDGQAVDSLDLAGLLDVVDGGPGLDQQRAGRFPSSLAQVVEQVLPHREWATNGPTRGGREAGIW
jgi:hypothetical protein